MRIWGKVLGAFFGFLLGNIFGALLGLWIGHRFDRGMGIRGAFQRAPRDTAVIVVRSQFDPALGALAGDIGAARVALCIERVELLLEPFLARFSRVDGAAQAAGGFCGHVLHASPRFRSRSPKKR